MRHIFFQCLHVFFLYTVRRSANRAFCLRPLRIKRICGLHILFYNLCFLIVDLISEVVVNFVSVIFPRVVAGGNHNSAGNAHGSDRKRNHGDGRRLSEEINIHTVIGKFMRHDFCVFF